MAKLIILIAGNIASGKTTLLTHLKKNEQVFSRFLSDKETLKVVPEFIDPVGLDLFYKDRKRYTNGFETSCLYARINRYQDAKNHEGIVIFDRGIIEGAETFGKNSFEEGYFSHRDYENYIKTLKDALDSLGRINGEQEKWLERLIIYMQVKDTGILKERIKERSTKGETIPEDYLKRLNDKYKKFTENRNQIYKGYGVHPPDILTINAETNMNKSTNFLEDTTNTIAEKIGSILGEGKNEH